MPFDRSFSVTTSDGQDVLIEYHLVPDPSGVYLQFPPSASGGERIIFLSRPILAELTARVFYPHEIPLLSLSFGSYHGSFTFSRRSTADLNIRLDIDFGKTRRTFMIPTLSLRMLLAGIK